ncbi:MAG TPA: hypothetical protein VM553_14210 [Dongiaceae bacterium]|nr:hypothetical protein [Dongiaceae bacterium]
MSKQKIVIAVLGSGRVVELLTQRIGKRADLTLASVSAADAEPPTETDCVLYLPAINELAAGNAATRIVGLLRAGFDVVSTVPAVALAGVDLLGACREGSSTFHGTGGFQSSLITRFNRAFASITRNVRSVELIEELDVDELPAHPWASSADLGVESKDIKTITARAADIEGYYDAGLRTLSEAVFGNEQPDASVEFSASRGRSDDGKKRARKGNKEEVEHVLVSRSLGTSVAYDSVWTKRQGSSVPLRYRLGTTSADAVGHVTICFHDEGEGHPADHLTCVGLLDAVRPVYEGAPGILRNDLEINHVKTDDRLAHSQFS